MGKWQEDDGFYYDQLKVDDSVAPLDVRSIVGIIPLFAVEILEQADIDRLLGFRKRLEWFFKYRPDLGRHIAYCDRSGDGKENDTNNDPGKGHRLLAIPSRERLEQMLRYLLGRERTNQSGRQPSDFPPGEAGRFPRWICREIFAEMGQPGL